MNRRDHAARAPAGEFDCRQMERNDPRVTFDRGALFFDKDAGGAG
jgi:hypothetical protein